MNLQYLRTDAGRINFISLFENLFSYVPRNKPIELKEIRSDENKNKIDKFNRIFKQDGILENYLNAQSPKTIFKCSRNNEIFLIGYKPKNMFSILQLAQ